MYRLPLNLSSLPQISNMASIGRFSFQPARSLVGLHSNCGAHRLTIRRQALFVNSSTNHGSRLFHTSPSLGNKKKTVWGRLMSWRSVAGVAIAGSAWVYLYESIRKEKEEIAAKERNKVVGQAALGGEWKLTRLDGTQGGSEDLRGDFALLYFGFTHCPDICPEEIEKAVKVVDAIDGNEKIGRKLIPVFITIDPERDTADIVKSYIAEFSPKMVGYVGSPEEVKEASRKFRVYFSKGPEDEDGDYIVDHSIIMYLIGPDGMFMDYFGQNKKAQEMIDVVTLQMLKWDAKEKSEKKSGIMSMLS